MSIEGIEPTVPLRSAAAPAARRSLPALGTYLRMVVALGVGSMRPALPLLIFAYFYNLGTELYLAFSLDTDAFGESQAFLSGVMSGVAQVPLWFLVTALLLPMQDSLLRGERRSFPEAVPIAVRRMPALILSMFVQALILLGPPLLLLGGVGLFVKSLPTLPGSPVEVLRGALFLALIPSAIYVLVFVVLFWLTEPALILDSRGPLASIGRSVSLGASHFGGMLGRVIVFNLLLILAMLVAITPVLFLEAGAALSGSAQPAVKVAQIIWDSLAAAASYPFTVAAVLVLYRALQPYGGATAADGTPLPGTAAATAPRATSPFQFE
ncbi:MAG TPA: hypothetical protein VFP58_09755 [Candidatus Eisenbacteria bacterium]|nr:hypothetical protein [Candidatus Eisenbacteria bacterium]